MQTTETNNSSRHIIRSENSSGDTKAEFNNCYFYYSFKLIPSLKTSSNMLTSIELSSSHYCMFIGTFRR